MNLEILQTYTELFKTIEYEDGSLLMLETYNKLCQTNGTSQIKSLQKQYEE